MSWKKGWIENRRSGAAKVSQLVDYRVVRAEEFQQLAGDRLYSHTGLNHGASSQMMGKLLRCDLPDLYNGNILICGPDPLQQGFHLEIQLTLSNYNCKLKFIAEAVAVHMDAEMKEMVFSAGIKALAVNKDDVDLLNRIIERQKNS